MAKSEDKKVPVDPKVDVSAADAAADAGDSAASASDLPQPDPVHHHVSSVEAHSPHGSHILRKPKTWEAHHPLPGSEVVVPPPAPVTE